MHRIFPTTPMKTKLALFATWLAAAASLAAAPLTATTAVQTRPDDAAPLESAVAINCEGLAAHLLGGAARDCGLERKMSLGLWGWQKH